MNHVCFTPDGNSHGVRRRQWKPLPARRRHRHEDEALYPETDFGVENTNILNFRLGDFSGKKNITVGSNGTEPSEKKRGSKNFMEEAGCSSTGAFILTRCENVLTRR